jgi:hypothetical protein
MVNLKFEEEDIYDFLQVTGKTTQDSFASDL